MASPKQKKKKQDFTIAWSMLFFVLAIVGFIGMMHPLDLEPFDTFNDIMKYFLGKWHILLPFVFLVFSMRILLGIKLVRLNASFVAFIIIFICAPALFHHIQVPIHEELFPEHLKHGGGLWGGTIALILHRLVGNIPTLLLLSIGCLTAIALLVPWGEILSSKKRDEEYEEFLKETERMNEEAVRKGSSKNKHAKVASQPAVKATEEETKPVSVAPSRMRQNVYDDEQFASFTEGIRQESPFKRMLNLGGKDKVYADAELQEEIKRDPIQIPEWEEKPKSEVILRPAIKYGNTYTSSTLAEDETVPAPQENVGIVEPVVKEESKEAVAKSAPIKPYEPIISNPYHNAEPAIVAKEQAEVNDGEEKESEEKLIIRRPQEEKGAASGYNPAFDGYVDAAKDTEAAAFAAQGVEVKASKHAAPPKPKQYKFPPISLLTRPKQVNAAAGDAEIMSQCEVLEQTLKDFHVRAKVIAATRGPAVTQFELQPAPGVKVNSIVNLADDIALRLAARGVRIEAPIPGKSAIGVEVPNLKTDPVFFREVVDNELVRNNPGKLCVGLGKDINGKIITANLADMPHLLIAGSTGSGKSVCINTIICGILYKALPEEVKLILVDPKVVELSVYDGIPHLLVPVVTDPKKAASALHWAVGEMERRYKLFADNHVRNMAGYNAQTEDKLPYILIVIDEMADLMATVKADIETAIMRLAAKARAAGIHMILATQRPSVDVITGVLKNNIPSRIAFAVTSLIDSRTILDSAGAEKLLGKGDMLYAPSGTPKPTRVQGAFVSDEEVGKIVDSIISQDLPVEYSDDITSVELESDKKNTTEENTVNDTPDPTEDPLFEKALMLVLDTGQASASMMQRRFSIGYNRAARLVDSMAELGIIGKAMGSKPREVIMPRQQAEELFLHNND